MESISGIVGELSTRLQQLGYSKEQADTIAASAVFFFRNESPTRRIPPGHLGWFVPELRWVIRDEDLKLVDALFSGATAAAGAGYFIGSIPTGTPLISAVTGLLTATLRLVYNIKRSGAFVSIEQAQIIQALKSNKEGMTRLRLLKFLQAKDSAWTEEKVNDALASLVKLRTPKGFISLVAEDQMSRWVLQDV